MRKLSTSNVTYQGHVFDNQQSLALTLTLLTFHSSSLLLCSIWELNIYLWCSHEELEVCICCTYMLMDTGQFAIITSVEGG